MTNLRTSSQIDRRQWNTYGISGYTSDVANDRASQGGVHIHQVRRTRDGFWQTRIKQSNGRHTAYGPVSPISDAEGEARFATAEQEASK